MSRIRHAAGPEVRTMSIVGTTRYTWKRRPEEWSQLLFAPRGTLTVHTDDGAWVVPADQALWVPAGQRHDVEIPARSALRMVFFSGALKVPLPRRCRLVPVSPLLRELLRRVMQLKTLSRRTVRERALLTVLTDELTTLPAGPFTLPAPRDPRGARAAALVRAEPDGGHTLQRVAREAFASPRTLERIFRSETGLPFGAWCRRARLLHSLQALADGESVTRAALAAGYESTSAFVVAFRRQLGVTPGRYFVRPVTAPR